jgi:hypothetical protein
MNAPAPRIFRVDLERVNSKRDGFDVKVDAFEIVEPVWGTSYSDVLYQAEQVAKVYHKGWDVKRVHLK